MSRAMIERIDLHFQWSKGSTHRGKRAYLPENLQRKKYCRSFDDYRRRKEEQNDGTEPTTRRGNSRGTV